MWTPSVMPPRSPPPIRRCLVNRGNPKRFVAPSASSSWRLPNEENAAGKSSKQGYHFSFKAKQTRGERQHSTKRQNRNNGRPAENRKVRRTAYVTNRRTDKINSGTERNEAEVGIPWHWPQHKNQRRCRQGKRPAPPLSGPLNWAEEPGGTVIFFLLGGKKP